MTRPDAEFVALHKAIYGESVDVAEAWEIAKLATDAPDVHVDGQPKPKKPKNPEAKKEGIAAGLLLGVPAESLAAAGAIHHAVNRVKTGAIVGAKQKGLVGGLKAFKAGRGYAVGEAGLQAANLGVGLLAARELLRKPEQAPVNKAARIRLRAINAGQVSNRQPSLRARRPARAPFVSKSFDAHVEIAKVDPHKHQVFGWAQVAKWDGEEVLDRQGDEVDIEELEKTAYDYVLDARIGGDQHARVAKAEDAPKHTMTLIESMVFTPEKIEKMGLPADFPQGWWTGYYVHDEQAWDDIIHKRRTGLSVHGTGRRELVSKRVRLSKAAKVHFSVRAGKPACGTGYPRWGSSQITTTHGTKKVDCAACKKTAAFRKAVGHVEKADAFDSYEQKRQNRKSHAVALTAGGGAAGAIVGQQAHSTPYAAKMVGELDRARRHAQKANQPVRAQGRQNTRLLFHGHPQADYDRAFHVIAAHEHARNAEAVARSAKGVRKWGPYAGAGLALGAGAGYLYSQHRVKKDANLRQRARAAVRPPEVTREPVPSTAVASMGYQPQTHRLAYEMRSRPGQPYHYKATKAQAYAARHNASIGHHYATQVRGQLPRKEKVNLADRARLFANPPEQVQKTDRAVQRRRRVAGNIETAGSLTAGTIGAGFAGAEARKQFKEEHPGRYERMAGGVERWGAKGPRRSLMAHDIVHGKPPLVAFGTLLAAGAMAGGAHKYQQASKLREQYQGSELQARVQHPRRRRKQAQAPQPVAKWGNETLTPQQVARRQKRASIYAKTGAVLGLGALGSKAGAAGVRRFVRPATQGAELADKLERHTSTVLAGGAGLSAISGFNSAKLSRNAALREQQKTGAGQ